MYVNYLLTWVIHLIEDSPTKGMLLIIPPAMYGSESKEMLGIFRGIVITFLTSST